MYRCICTLVQFYMYTQRVTHECGSTIWTCSTLSLLLTWYQKLGSSGHHHWHSFSGRCGRPSYFIFLLPSSLPPSATEVRQPPPSLSLSFNLKKLFIVHDCLYSKKCMTILYSNRHCSLQFSIFDGAFSPTQ